MTCHILQQRTRQFHAIFIYLFIHVKDSKLYSLVLLNVCCIAFPGPPSHLIEAGAPTNIYENLIADKILS